MRLVSISDELLAEKEKYKVISDELDQTFAELAGMWGARRRQRSKYPNIHQITSTALSLSKLTAPIFMFS